MANPSHLGHNTYVQQRLKARYCDPEYPLLIARGVQLQVAPEPQLAVCKGMVINRVQKLRSESPVLSSRCCRASYGLLCKDIYNERNPLHKGIAPEKDSIDGKSYVKDTVSWFLKKVLPLNPAFGKASVLIILVGPTN